MKRYRVESKSDKSHFKVDCKDEKILKLSAVEFIQQDIENA